MSELQQGEELLDRMIAEAEKINDPKLIGAVITVWQGRLDELTPKPDVGGNCQQGYHWDNILNKCVLDAG